MPEQVSNKKVAYILAVERIENNIDSEFQGKGFVDEDFFYEDFFKKEFPRDVVKHVITRLERQNYLNAWIIKECFECGEENFRQEENFFNRETYKELMQGKDVIQCHNCQHTVDVVNADWLFTFSQNILENGEEVEDEPGTLQKIRNFFRVEA